ncbi:MAG TPA: aminodeoxychorismate lyase [Desulfotomaculum sp.]|nr:aminodeoxychorismate lyase [Desulfotomaculum sp.]
MGAVICLNGRFLPADHARVSVLDQGFLYGYGLFETILVRQKRPVLLAEHLNRLKDGSAVLGMTPPLPLNELPRLVEQTIAENGTVDGALRLTLSAGTAPGGVPGNLIISTRPLPYGPRDYRQGFRAGWSSLKRNEYSPLVRLKTLNHLENLLARREAREKGWNEALFLNTAGFVAEGTLSNIFIIKDKRVVTPSIDQGLLPGIMRRVVLETCRRLGIEVQERPVCPAELTDAGECFLTNSLMVVMPLISINGRPIGGGRPGMLTGLIEKTLRELPFC